MTPNPSDRITLHTRDGEYTIAACFGDKCGILSPLWPLGASQQIELHEIATVNGQPVQFPKAGSKTKRGQRR